MVTVVSLFTVNCISNGSLPLVLVLLSAASTRNVYTPSDKFGGRNSMLKGELAVAGNHLISLEAREIGVSLQGSNSHGKERYTFMPAVSVLKICSFSSQTLIRMSGFEVTKSRFSM